jgi:hypothetical protein
MAPKGEWPMFGTGPPVQRASVSLTTVAVDVAAPLMKHWMGLPAAARMKPRPCTTALEASLQWSDAEGMQTYWTSSHTDGIHKLITLEAAPSWVWWRKKYPSPEDINLTFRALA